MCPCKTLTTKVSKDNNSKVVYCCNSNSNIESEASKALVYYYREPVPIVHKQYDREHRSITVTLSSPFLTSPMYLKFVPYPETNLFLTVPGFNMILPVSLRFWSSLGMSMPMNSMSSISHTHNNGSHKQYENSLHTCTLCSLALNQTILFL